MPQMEDFTPQLSGAVGRQVVYSPRPSANVLSAFHSLLPSVGWTVTEVIEPIGSVSYPLGYPVTSSTSPCVSGCTPVGCGRVWLQIGDIVFNIYNPHSETPLPSAKCVMVPIGLTPAAGLANLAAAVSANTNFDATVVFVGPGDSYRLDLEGKVGQIPELLNYTFLAADGSYGTPGEIDGGGYEFESLLPSAPNGNTAQYRVAITSSAPSLQALVPDGRIFFDFTINGGTAEYVIDVVPFSGPAITQYTIVANGYQFAIFDDSTTLYSLESRNLLACAPYIPVGYQSAYAVFVIGRVVPFTTSWPATLGALTTALDSAPSTYTNSGGFPRSMTFRMPGTTPLLTLAGEPLLQAPLVMFGKTSSDTASVVGKMWDALISTDVLGDGVQIDGHKYSTVASQDGSSGNSRSTLLLRID